MSYEAVVESPDTVTRVVSVSYSVEGVRQVFESVTQEYTRKAQVKGFRPGKAPRHLIESLYASNIKSQVMEKLVSTALEALVKEHKIRYVGQPDVDMQYDDLKQGQEFKFKTTFALYPEPELVGLDDIKIALKKDEIDEKSVDATITRILDSRATFEAINEDRATKYGDVVEYQYTLVSSSVKGGATDTAKFELKEGSANSEITEGLLGLKVGETRRVEFNRNNKQDADKPDAPKLEYDLVVKGLLKKVLPELDDKLAAEIDQECKNVAEFRSKIRDLLSKDLDRQVKQKAEAKIIKELTTKNQFAVPQMMVDREIISLLGRFGAIDRDKLESGQFDITPFRENMAAPSLEKIRASIIVDRIAEIEKIEPSEDDVRNWVNEAVADGSYTPEQMRDMVSDQDKLAGIFIEARRKKVLETLYSRVKIDWVDVDPDAEASAQAVA